MKKLNKTQLARELGLSRTTIYNMIKSGKLVPDSYGLITVNDDNSLPKIDKCQEQNDSVRLHCTEEHPRVHDVHRVGTASSRMKDRYIAHLEKQLERTQRELDEVKKENQKLTYHIFTHIASTFFNANLVKMLRYDGELSETIIAQWLKSDTPKFMKGFREVKSQIDSIQEIIELAEHQKELRNQLSERLIKNAPSD